MYSYFRGQHPFRAVICLHFVQSSFFLNTAVAFSQMLNISLPTKLLIYTVCTHADDTLLFPHRTGTPPECFRNQTSFSLLWVFWQCHKSFGTSPCWKSRLTGGRWCVMPLRGTFITEKTSGKVQFSELI